MTPETFLQNLNQLAQTPGAMKRMRELVLGLAMRGRLVEQNPNDGDAESLLMQMEAVRQDRGAGRKSAEGDRNEGEECVGWHSVPSSWRWMPLSKVGTVVGGGTPRSDDPSSFADEGIPWLTPADLSGFKGKTILRGRRFITEAGLANSSAQLLPAGTVLFSSRAPIGYVAIAGVEMATNQGFKSCIPFIRETSEFIYYYLMSAAPRIDREAPGTTFREVSGRIMKKVPVPLPPLAEQRRIVDKLDELLALCDQLESQQHERDTRQAQLARASLARFTDAPTPGNLNLLFHRDYTIPAADLRKSVLALAVQGRLVSRDPSEEEATISFPKLTSVAAGSEDDAFPGHWLRFSLGQVGEWRGGGTPSKSRPDFWSGEIPWVSPKDMKALRISDSADHISPEAVEASSVRLIPSGSVLMVVRGMILARAFPVALTTREVTINQDMKALLPLYPETGEFLLLLLRALEPQVLAGIERSSHGTCKLQTDFLHSLTVALPPRAEQRRIVAKVNHLMAWVDRLEADLGDVRDAAAELMDAAACELLA